MVIGFLKKFNKVKFHSVFYFFLLLSKQLQFGLIEFKKIYLIFAVNCELRKIWRKNLYIYYLNWLNNNDFVMYTNARLGMARPGLGWLGKASLENKVGKLRLSLFLSYNFSHLYCLYLMEYLQYELFLFNIKGNFLTKHKLPLILYDKYILRLPFFWYATFNTYCEYFRYIKYREYLNRYKFRLNNNYLLHWKQKYRKKYYFGKFNRFHTLLDSYRFNLICQRYWFYNSKSIIQVNYCTFLVTRAVEKLRGKHFLVWQSFSLFFDVYRKCFLFLKIFFEIWIIRFCYRFFIKMPRQFLHKFKFYKPTEVYILFLFLRYTYKRWIFWYLYRQFYKTIRVNLDIRSYFNNSLSDYNYVWLKIIRIAFYELIHNVFFFRCLDQLEADMYMPLSKLFVTLWELFTEWWYIDLTIFDFYYFKLNEFKVWIHLLKYNLEILTCSILNSPHLNLVNLNIINGINRAFTICNKSNIRLYECFYQNYIKKYKFQDNLIFFCFQVILLVGKLLWVLNYNYSRKNYNYLKYKEMRLSNLNILIFHKCVCYREFCKGYAYEYDDDVLTLLPL